MAKFRVRVSVEMEEESNNWGNGLDENEEVSVATALERFKKNLVDEPEYIIEYSEEPFQVELLDPPPAPVQVNLSDNLSLGDKIS